MPPGTWWLAAGLIAAELLAAVAGASTLLLAAAALLAPGYALTPLLPRALRATPIAVLACAPALGLAATSLTLISLSAIGVPLTGVSVRAALLALLLAGLALALTGPGSEAAAAGADPESGDADAPAGDADSRSAGTAAQLPAADSARWRGPLLDLVLLTGILAGAALLGWRVIGELPIPGDDWAKYLLYADEIRNQGALLLQNQLWMGGRPFSEDPGIPSLEGAALLMTGADAGALVRAILALSLLQVAVAFGAARAQLGRTAAVVAGLLMVLAPASQNMLGWHGLANVGALAIMPLVLAQLGAWLQGDLDRRAEVGLAIAILGVGAAHRLTAVFLAGTLLLMLAAAALTPQRRALLLGAARTLAWTAALGLLVAIDVRQRAADSGGALPYTSYLNTKVDLELALRDLTPLLFGAALLSVAVLGARGRLPRIAWPPLALAAVSIALGWAWLVQLPLYYSRVVFFLPLPLALLAATGAQALADWSGARSSPTPRRVLGGGIAALAIGIAAATVIPTWRQAEEVRQYYAFASPQSLEALDALAPSLRPGEIVVTDRCWSFLATWLLHTRTYPALEEQDIQPKAELVVARRAAAVLQGTAEGRRLIKERGLRFAIVDPTCPINGPQVRPPGTLLFAGDRMAIIALDAAERPAGRSGTRR